MFVGKQFISVEVQRQACHHDMLNPKIHRTDHHPHIPQLCLVLTAVCTPNAKTNLRDLNCQCRLSNVGIHIQNMSGRQICKTPGLNRLPRLTSPPPCSSRRPDSSQTLPLTGTPYHLTRGYGSHCALLDNNAADLPYRVRMVGTQLSISFSSRYDRQVLANHDRSKSVHP